MPIILRIDVDRPYGKRGIFRHSLSRLASDLYFPAVESCGYLRELVELLQLLNAKGKCAHVCFRRCTLPSSKVLALMKAGSHIASLHLENSRSYNTFLAELTYLEHYIGDRVWCFSKHGSGRMRFGCWHYAPYEPEKYIEWAKLAKLRLFFGNLEDPSILPIRAGPITFYPSAFWLEPHWRDVSRFSLKWLASEARKRSIVLLLHPENVLLLPGLMREFEMFLEDVAVATLSPAL